MARKFYYNEGSARELLREALHVIASGEETHYFIHPGHKYKENDRKITGVLRSLSGEQIQDVTDRAYSRLDSTERMIVNTMFKLTESDARMKKSRLQLKYALRASAMFAGKLEDLILENELERLIDLDSL